MGGDQKKVAGKAKLDDEAKKETAYLKEDAGEDRIGELARGGAEGAARVGEEDGEYISTTIQLAAGRFKWIADDVRDRLTQLKKDISRPDKPPWLKGIAEGLLEYAIPLGLGAGAKALSSYLVEKREPGKSPIEKAKADGVKELLKSIFKDSAVAGANWAKGRLGASPESSSDAFVDAQKEGAIQALFEAETAFTTQGASVITSRAQAEPLRAVFLDYDKIREVADHQYQATRDAWVSYLAQTKFGSKKAPDGKGQIADMSGQADRDHANEKWFADPAEQTLKPPEPSPNAAIWGKTPGVLEVVAELPDIRDRRARVPTVRAAMLNGVNDAIRDQYKGKPLAELKIPRQIVAKVNSDFLPSFTVSIDETGAANPITSKDGQWLRARAIVGGSPIDASEERQQHDGLRLLLSELIPAEIVEKLGP